MKKILTGILLIGILCLPLAGCGKGEEARGGFEPASDAQFLLSSGAFTTPLTEVDQATACHLYGIDAGTVTACAVYGSTSTAEELAIFKLKDDSSAQTTADQLQLRAEDRIDELTNYMPKEIPKLEHAVIEIRKNTALLVIASDYAPVEKFLEN